MSIEDLPLRSDKVRGKPQHARSSGFADPLALLVFYD